MIFVIRTDDDVAGIDIVEALQIAGINHEIVSKQKHELSQNSAIAAKAIDRISRIALEATDAGRIASDHMMKSSAADYDLNRQFAADMAAWEAEQNETSHRAEKIADAAELAAAESFAAAGLPLPRRKVLRVAQTATEKSVTYYNDWAAFCKRVDETDCSSQWADRWQDH